MKKIFLILLSFVFVQTLSSITWASSIDTPLANDANTVALWNFDSDTGTTVVDSAASPLNGTAYNAGIVAGIPGLSPLFGVARQFTGASSFVDFGTMSATKLDFTNATALSVEAYIYLSVATPGLHMIFDNGQVQLAVIADHLAGFVMQSGGYRGVVAIQPLMVNTPYRVGLSLGGGRLGIFANERVMGNVAISEVIQASSNPVAHSFVGGNILSQYFPGYIDDIRVSNIARFETIPPSVTLVSPSATVPVHEAFPEFHVTYQDLGIGANISGIDASSLHVFLNGTEQTGIAHDATGFTAHLTSALTAGAANELKVQISDNLGNFTESKFFVSYTRLGAGTEYQTDANTLALWHMDENSTESILDSSGRELHGYGSAGVGTGVFGRGRIFNASNFVTIPMLSIPDHQFTFETWLQPSQNPTSGQEQVLLATSQIRVTRFGSGNLRVALLSVRSPYIFESSTALFPLGELHHVAVVWDGPRGTNNLLIYKDGVIAQVFTAPAECDFSPTPAIGNIGFGFAGMLDEMRVSRSVRDTFNLITRIQMLSFSTLQAGSSTDIANPELHVLINTVSPVNPSDVRVRLNGVLQPTGTTLIVTGTAIDGTMQDAMHEGLNTIEVELLDAEGNQVIENHHVFYIPNGGGRTYNTDASTIGLWRFEDPDNNFMEDLSGRGNHIVMGESGNVMTTGIVGRARAGAGMATFPNITLRSRSFTLEGWFRPYLNTTLSGSMVNLVGSGFNLSVNYNRTTRNVNLGFTTADGTLNQDMPNAIPDDGQFHHVAMVFDNSRDFAQAVVVIDGVVKGAYDYRCRCNFSQPLQLRIGPSHNVEFDELRLLNRAVYTFNRGNGSPRPTIASITTPVAGSTVHTPNIAVSYSFQGSVPLHITNTHLRLNGVAQSGLTVNTSGLQGTLTGTITGLRGGANSLELHVVDVNGQEQVLNNIVYYIAPATPTPYTSDANTLALWHLDETTGGTFTDSSINHSDLTRNQPWLLGQAGVFGTNAAGFSTGTGAGTLNQATGTITPLNNLLALSLEGWFKQTSTSGAQGFVIYVDNLVYLFFNDRSLAFRWYSRSGGTTDKILTSVIPADLQYHHVAAVLDANHPLRQMYIVFDGNVVSSAYYLPDYIILHSTATLRNAAVTGYLRAQADEVRLSSTARYTLGYSQTLAPEAVPLSLAQRLREKMKHSFKSLKRMFMSDSALRGEI